MFILILYIYIYIVRTSIDLILHMSLHTYCSHCEGFNTKCIFAVTLICTSLSPKSVHILML